MTIVLIWPASGMCHGVNSVMAAWGGALFGPQLFQKMQEIVESPHALAALPLFPNLE